MPGFDCSGFICYVFKRFGIEVPRTSAEQFDAGIPIPYTDAQPGDLILFAGSETDGGSPGHVGIVLSYNDVTGFSFIHTSSPESGGVRISNEMERIFFQIVVPMSWPGLIATFMITLSFVWNEFLNALLLTTSKWQTLPVWLTGQNSYRGDEWWAIAVAAVISITPMIVVAAALSRFMRSGLAAGAIR